MKILDWLIVTAIIMWCTSPIVFTVIVVAFIVAIVLFILKIQKKKIA